MKANKIIPMLLLLVLCACNKFKMYDGPSFFYFDMNQSGSTSINELGSLTSEYYVHYTGEQASETRTVVFSVTPGSGLQEGVDYQMVTTGTSLSFLPGIIDLPIRVKWLPHALTSAEGNTLTVSLESVNDPKLKLGLPPSGRNRSVSIQKYKN